MSTDTAVLAPDASGEIAALVQLLHDTDRRLEELLGGQVDTVTDREGRTIVLRSAQAHLRRNEDAASDARVALSIRTERRERLLNTMLSSISDFIYSFDRDGRFVFVNRPLLDLWGMTLEDALGKNFHDLPYTEELATRLQREIEQVFTSRETLYGETPYDSPTGAVGYYHYIFSPAFAVDGTVDYVVGCTREYTAIRASELALRESVHELSAAQMEITRTNRELRNQKEELRVLFNLVPASIVFKDTSNRLVRVNERMAHSVGKSVAQIEGTIASDLFPPEDAARYAAEDQEIIRTRRPKMAIVRQMNDAAGRAIWVQNDKVPYVDESGAVIGIVVMSVDITQQKVDQDTLRDLNADLEARVRSRTAELNLAREEAERANGAKSEFLATMSHEIRTPMSGLLGMLELLGLTALSDDQSSTLAVARQSGGTLLQIIDDILDFSKIEANRLELNPVPASVKDTVEAACRLHNQVASSKNLTLGCVIDPQMSPCHAFDPLRLGQILSNFLSNAIKFTEAGRVDVAVDLLGSANGIEQLRFTVCDTGIGMSDDEMRRLFHPFVQACRGTSARFGGTGLGLVIARRLAALMCGEVEIHSAAGMGSTLTLTVGFETCENVAPAAAVAGGSEELVALLAGRRAAPSVEDALADGTLLLVVDDHPTNRRVLMAQVASLGYAAESAKDGVEAFEAFRKGRYGAVLTDCNMPGMNGYEFAEAVRRMEALEGLPRSPIIGCTANAMASASALCLGAGMDDCIVKPAGLLDIGSMLDRWLPLGGRGDPSLSTGALAAFRAFTAAAPGLLDMVLLNGISGGDPAVQAEIVREFQRVNATDASALRHCAAERSFTSVMQASHRIKGSSLMLGSTLLARACEEIEAAGAARDPQKLQAGMERFETELLRLDLHLNAVLAAVPAP